MTNSVRIADHNILSQAYKSDEIKFIRIRNPGLRRTTTAANKSSG
jgi:hypothetical protein